MMPMLYIKNLLHFSDRGHSIGSYTWALGLDTVRQHVADFIAARDGYTCDVDDVCLVQGAASGVEQVLKLLSNNTARRKSGVLVPVPKLPFYSASIAEHGLQTVDYYLDEDNNWALTKEELESSLKATEDKCKVKAIVVINPGNPTGQILSYDNIRSVIEFAYQNSLLIIADEVHQETVYAAPCKFYSFKRVLKEMGEPYADTVELVSLMSSSKGYLSEGGARGGWLEVVNMPPNVQRYFYKLLSTLSCSNVIGQIAIDCITKPPKEDEPSYEMYTKERKDILVSLRERAQMVVASLNQMKGVECNEIQGALYAFPKIKLPAQVIRRAKELKMFPDTFYATRLLEETGICIDPGSDFSQRPGTYHLRMTILPQIPILTEMLETLKHFHESFFNKYSSEGEVENKISNNL